MKYLYNAVANIPWAKITLTLCYAQNSPWNFHQLFAALDTFCLLEQRHSSLLSSVSNDSQSMMWKFQGIYEKSNTIRKNYQRPKYAQSNKYGNIGCCNCCRFGHTKVNCPKPRNVSCNANAITQSYSDCSKQISFELCKQLNKQSAQTN